MRVVELRHEGHQLMQLMIDNLDLKLRYYHPTEQFIDAPNPLQLYTYRSYGEWRLFSMQVGSTSDQFSGTLQYYRRSSGPFYPYDISFTTSKIPLLFSVDSFSVNFGFVNEDFDDPLYFLLKKLYISTIPNDEAYPETKITSSCYWDWAYDFICEQDSFILANQITKPISPTYQDSQGHIMQAQSSSASTIPYALYNQAIWFPKDGYLNVTTATLFSPTFSATFTARGDCALEEISSGILLEYLDQSNEPLMKLSLNNEGEFIFELLGQTAIYAQPEAIKCDQWFKFSVNVLPTNSISPEQLLAQFVVKYKTGGKTPDQVILEYPSQLQGTYKGQLIVAPTFQGLVWRVNIGPVLRGQIKWGSFSTPNSALLDCPHNSHENCEICDAKCGSCNGPTASDCLSCHDLTTSLASCQCPESHYYNAPTNACLQCSLLCTKCTGPSENECTQCQNEAYFVESLNSCVPHCGAAYVPDNTAFVCEPCPVHCLQCESSSICTECQSPYSLSQSQCIQQCPDSQFASQSIPSVCLECPSNCQTCLSYEDCLSCKSPYSLIEGTCIAPSQCPSHFYYDTITSSCLECAQECAECQASSNQCTLCSFSYFFDSPPPSPCLPCPQGYIFQANECLSLCGDGLVKGSQECDDSNLLPDDGCSPMCEIELNSYCNTAATKCYVNPTLMYYSLELPDLNLTLTHPLQPPILYNSSISGSLSTYEYSLQLISLVQNSLRFNLILNSDFLGKEELQIILNSNFTVSVDLPSYLYSFSPLTYSVLYFLFLVFTVLLVALYSQSDKMFLNVIFFVTKLQQLNVLLKMSIHQSGFTYFFLQTLSFSFFKYPRFQPTSQLDSTQFQFFNMLISLLFSFIGVVLCFQKVFVKKIGAILFLISYFPVLVNFIEAFTHYDSLLKGVFGALILIWIAFPFYYSSTSQAIRIHSFYFLTKSTLVMIPIYFLKTWSLEQLICVVALYSALLIADVTCLFLFSKTWTRNLIIFSSILQIAALSLLACHIRPQPFFNSLSSLTILLLGCALFLNILIQFGEGASSLKKKPKQEVNKKEKVTETSEVACVSVETGMQSEIILRSLQDN